MPLKLIEEFIYYNANDRGKYVGDCVKRALSLAFDIPYNEVQKELNKIAKEVNSNSYFQYKYNHMPIFKRFVETRGKEFEEYFNKQTLEEFANEHPDGSYVLLTGDPQKGVEGKSTHMVAVVDGDIYDSWNSSDQLVKYICTVQGERQNRKQGLTFEDLEKIRKEIDVKGQELITNIIESSRLYKNSDNIIYKVSSTCERVEGDIKFMIRFDIKDSDYLKVYTIACTTNPTHSAEQNINDALAKVQAKTKQCIYNFSQTLKKLFSNSVDDDVDTHYNPRYSDERKVFNSLPMWARKRIKDIDVSWSYYDARSKSYEITMVVLPDDPRAESPDDILYIKGDNMKELLDNIEEYRDGYRRLGYDY